ncbi:MAG: phosphoenolpyruvate carboxylase [Xanthomonadales bacterium]|nr:phosphoenolpyruvate carboxylase [Xanthomonadales bacterium]NNE06624.1 phosphoenolpyruvate carboxylase [Xanthomonadales bacterium]
MSQIREIEFPQKDLPLRADVSMLGHLLGEVIVEQHGEDLLALVERIRKAAIARREGDPDNAERMLAALDELPAGQHLLIIRAFSSYLRLVNIAEDIHRIRRNRAYLKDQAAAQRGSLADVLGGFRQHGVAAQDVGQALQRLRVEPVFTAHPTEATRRSILEKSYSIVHRLVDRFNPDLTPAEEQMALARIRDAVTSGWQTRTVSHERPTVADELDNILFYLVDILYRMVPAWHESLQRALAEHYTPDIAPQDPAAMLRFGSWVGGDMDGNPNVGAATIRDTLVTQRAAIIRRYIPELRQLGRYLSQTRGDAGFSDTLLERVAAYSERYHDVAADIPRRHREMPYRCFFRFVSHRLKETLADTADAYASADAFRDDVECVEQSLAAHKGEHAGLFGVRRLLVRIRTFGFHLATLDVRQDAELHREVMAELLGIDDWAGWSREQRCEHLEGLLKEDKTPAVPETASLSQQASDTLDVFRTIHASQQGYGAAAIGLFVISMTQGADDVLTTLALARIATEERDIALDIAPLLETVDDLEAGPQIFNALLGLESYRRHLDQRGQRQVIMVGYSDSNKDAGIVASRWGLQQAQARLLELGSEHGVETVFFHGRGGTVSRGGGNLVSGIIGAPAGTVNGYVRVTEQGEVINRKYGTRPIALRNLELMGGAALQHQLSDVGQHPEPEMCAVLDAMASSARARYRSLVHDDPGFVAFFRAATPIDVIERLAIGSRPASRRSGEGIGNLRAIPWVFSWAQTRVGFPGVFGVGTALESAARDAGLDCLRDMYRRWQFFHGMVNDVEMVLAKSELDVGRRYAELAGPEGSAMFETIAQEFALASRHILAIKQQDELLADQHTLRRNIRLRNPYVDPLHVLQIDLLQRWRAGGREDEDLLNALKASVNGIAQGIQNTG